MKRRFPLFAVMLLTVTVLRAEPNFAALRFGMHQFDTEKILGSSTKRKSFANPEVEYGLVYHHAQTRDLLPGIIYDRDGKAVAFVFALQKFDNGGLDPATGKPWVMPASTRRWVLGLFSSGQKWIQLKSQDDTTVWRLSDGTMFAAIRLDLQAVGVCNSEEIARLKLFQ